ncbi:MAG TPA: ABC transporter substrate-binding protein [Chloroflexota bacterium]
MINGAFVDRGPRRRAAAGLLTVVAIALALACGLPSAQPSGNAPAGGASAGSAPDGASPSNPPAAGGSAGAAAQAAQSAPAAPAEPVKLRVAYSEVYPGATIPWTTYEAGIFAKHGLDVDLSYVASSQTVPAVIANEVDISLGGGYAVINSRLAGSDLQMFLGVVNFYQYELMVNPDIAGPADLKGQKLGVSRFGSASDQATRVLLQQFGLVPDQDVVLIQTGSMQERVAAMQAGAVAGGVAAPPDPTRLRRLGFKSLYDLSKSGQQDLNSIAFASQAWLRSHEATVQAFVDAMVEGVHYAKTNRPFAEQVLKKYLQMDDDELLNDSYEMYVGANLARVPDPGREAAQRYLEEQAATDPRAVGARLDDFFDVRFVDKVNTSGLVPQLYGKD